jgi:TetR/AcrR family transcriptional regulator, mexJK operon transcriptional repressor
MKQSGSVISAPQENGKEERVSRIVTASLEVFSEFSFQDATTGEIARRARVSKRDIYAHFPDKHALLIATLNKALQTEISNITAAIARTQNVRSLQKRLEIIGSTLIDEVLSAAMSVLTRLVASESINRPLIGSVYFENGPVQRTVLISEVLSSHNKDGKFKSSDVSRAAEHYLALVTYRPTLTTSMGMVEMWDLQSVHAHVASAVECFLTAYPDFS